METGSNGIILYEFQSYPGVWSEAIVLPPTAKGFAVAWAEGMKITATADGVRVADPSRFKTRPGCVLRFMSLGDGPVPTAVRIAMRNLTAGEKQVKFVMPQWPGPAVVLAPERQAMSDELLTLVRNTPLLTGTALLGKTKEDMEASLVWNEESQTVTGSFNFPKLKVKKMVEGRILDDGINPIYLQLIETRVIEKGSKPTVLDALYCELHLDTNLAGQLDGTWQWDRPFACYKGTLTLQPAVEE